MTTITLEQVSAALCLPDFDGQAAREAMRLHPDVPQDQPPPGADYRQAGVLVLVYPRQGALTTLLMQRTDHPGVHAGQISFPGGAAEPGDADLTATALREACEEVGVCREQVTVLGQLSPVYIPPSRFYVLPVVAALPARPAFFPSPAEVAALLEISLADLFRPESKRRTTMPLGGAALRVPCYAIEEHVVWGATALMLAELEARLRAVR
ncbi:MAG: CoA pyrophosphatase [Anaerolineae bacterium]|nr:CoA pyrophosphatase [Anaerolineae bacterium]